jgi:hypothetical protein
MAVNKPIRDNARYGSLVSLHIVLFEDCSAFTRVAACRRSIQIHKREFS